MKPMKSIHSMHFTEKFAIDTQRFGRDNFGVAALQIVRYDDYVRNHHWRRLGWIWQFEAL